MVTSSLARSACEPDRAWIKEQVRLKRNAQAIYRDLVDQFGTIRPYTAERYWASDSAMGSLRWAA